MSSLFKSKSKATKTPFEEDLRSSSTSTQDQTQTENTLTNLARSLAGTQSTSTTGTTGGLADTALTDPLTKAFQGVDLTGGQADADIYTGLINNRLGDTTPEGYRTNRNRAVEDYNRTVNQIGHRGAIIGRGGDARERALGIANERLGGSLLDAYDTSRTDNENALGNLIAGRQAAPISQLAAYGQALSQSPLATQDTQQSDTDRTQQETETESALRELASLLNTSSQDKSYKKGFGTTVTQTPSVASQLAGLAAAAASAYAAGK